MTTPILPEFILKLFQNEVNNIVQTEIKKVCELYQLNFDEVIQKLGHIEIKTTEHPGFQIIKKKKNIVSKEKRCLARLLCDLEIKQCSKPKIEDCDFCGLHMRLNEENKLKYGKINDPLPDELRPEILNEKKLNKIY